MAQTTEKIVLGIDPGTMYMGYGVIRVLGQKIEYVDMGILDLKKEKDIYLKLKKIYDFTIELIKKYLPDEFAIEAQFFGKNVQSMLKLGRAQGVAIVAALERDIPVAEYAPLKIKQAITGNGMASKEQVSQMLKALLKLKTEDLPEHLDATDALAAAVCHHFETRTTVATKKYSSWADFESKMKK
ncbi:MAG: crossover junction endodeoxyribonuclease RuvC [Paludibacteraceae bacterium]|nr:crossover junction endodeoxyribonuclease RuvC [Paludibacteraceae bacterium]